METVYGFLSDADRGTSRHIIQAHLGNFIRRGVHAVVLLGEMGDLENGIASWAHDHHKNLFTIPGSHESLDWITQMRLLQQSYGIVNGIDQPFFDMRDHQLVFVPGTELVAGAGGFYLTNEGVTGVRMSPGGAGYFFNVNDIARSVIDPRTTLVMAHTPPLQQGPDATDYAYFHEGEMEETVGDHTHVQRYVTPGIDEEYRNLCRLSDEKLPVQHANRGYGPLRNAVDRVFPRGTLKLPHGHFTETFGRARTRDGHRVPERTYVSEVIHNASSLDVHMKAGIWTYCNGQVAVEKVPLPV